MRGGGRAGTLGLSGGCGTQLPVGQRCQRIAALRPPTTTELDPSAAARAQGAEHRSWLLERGVPAQGPGCVRQLGSGRSATADKQLRASMQQHCPCSLGSTWVQPEQHMGAASTQPHPGKMACILHLWYGCQRAQLYCVGCRSDEPTAARSHNIN
jgi:hypothetical protein